MRTAVTLTYYADSGAMTQVCWVVTDQELLEQIRGMLGDPACEVMMTKAALTAIEQAGDANGAVVMFHGSERA